MILRFGLLKDLILFINKQTPVVPFLFLIAYVTPRHSYQTVNKNH